MPGLLPTSPIRTISVISDASPCESRVSGQSYEIIYMIVNRASITESPLRDFGARLGWRLWFLAQTNPLLAGFPEQVPVLFRRDP